jgi:2-dehydro-3-deoxy-D-arabinonate dehydratase
MDSPRAGRIRQQGYAGSVIDSIGHLVRAFDTKEDDVVIGVTEADGVAPLREVTAISQLLHLDLADVESAVSRTGPAIPFERVRFLPPIDGVMEVWAAGVTYLASREARIEESGDRDVYRRVYEAERPELFFKSPAWRVVTDGEPIAVRADSPNNVPEPEVGLVLNSRAELVGFTMVDDVSSRSIEGANPLYLPQAKVYDGCCALGPSIVPRWLVTDETDIGIKMTIRREASALFVGESSTGRMKRSFAELAGFLFLQLTFPDGVVLATGTSVVPPLTTTLSVGDMVEISIDGLGRFTTPVAPADAVGAWLAERRADPKIAFGHESGSHAGGEGS